MDLNTHSPLGGSGMKRWSSCWGSHNLIDRLAKFIGEEVSSEFAAHGTALHDASAHCLDNRLDAWEAMGQQWNGFTLTSHDADGIQLYIDHVRKRVLELTAKYGECAMYVERGISSINHPLFYGRVDVWLVAGDHAEVWDAKFGAGIVVEAEGNKQLRYYGYGCWEKHPEVRTLTLGIVQPFAFHPQGPIRSEDLTAEELGQWADTELWPAMKRAETAVDLTPGTHCRHCPARLFCPALNSVTLGMAHARLDGAGAETDEALAAEYGLATAIKARMKAVEEEVFRRMQLGRSISTAKLVNKKCDRVWKDGAQAYFFELHGNAAYDIKLKSPAQMEEVATKALVQEWAYAPQAGYTVAPISDKRHAVTINRVPGSQLFTAQQNSAT